MQNLEQFAAHYDGLVIGQQATAYYQVIHAGSERVLGTFREPLEPKLQEVQETISSAGALLPTGQHIIRVVAMSATGIILGECGQVTHGLSQAARSAINDATKISQALAMNVETAQAQIDRMEQRAQAAEGRALHAEKCVADMMVEKVKIVDMVHAMQLRAEEGQLDRAEREARMDTIKQIGVAFMPVVNAVAETGAQFWVMKVQQWKDEAELAAEKRKIERQEMAEAAAKKAQAQAQAEPPPAPVETNTETPR